MPAITTIILLILYLAFIPGISTLSEYAALHTAGGNLTEVAGTNDNPAEVGNPEAGVPEIAEPGPETEQLFEGTLYYTLIINGTIQNLRYTIKNEFVRLEIDDPQLNGSLTALISPHDGLMVLLIHEIQAYAELSFNDIATRNESLVNQMDRVTETGNRKIIAGTETLEYIIQTDREEYIRFWSPTESTRFGYFQFPDFGNRILANILNHDLPGTLFPFAVEYQGERTHVELTVEKIEEKKLNLNLFTVPANYRKITLTIPDY